MISRFLPHQMIIDITQINIADLVENAVDGILLDLDGTLAHLNSGDIPENFIGWIQSNRTKIPLQIATCNHRRENLDIITEITGHRPICRQPFENPSNFFRRAALNIGCQPSKVAVANDSLIMLGLFVKPLGCYTIKVESINLRRERGLIGNIYHFGQWAEQKFILPHLKHRS